MSLEKFANRITDAKMFKSTMVQLPMHEAEAALRVLWGVDRLDVAWEARRLVGIRESQPLLAVKDLRAAWAEFNGMED